MVEAISYIGNACLIIAFHCFLIEAASKGNVGWVILLTIFCVLSWFLIVDWLFSMKGGW